MTEEEALKIASRYVGDRTELVVLGCGHQGYVFSTSRATAVKVFGSVDPYNRELLAYRRLDEHNVSEVLGFAVPRLIACDDSLSVIEMTMVQPPYVLDFASAELDDDSDIPGGEDQWMEELEQLFGDRQQAVIDLYFRLRDKFGVCHKDLTPRNVNFGD